LIPNPGSRQPQLQRAFPILAISGDRSFPEYLHRSSWCISRARWNSATLIQHRYRNILQSPSQVFHQKQSRESSPVDIRVPSPSRQSWQTNQKALPYGIDPKRHSAREALRFSSISQRQLKVSPMCRRGTVLAAPWRSPTTFQILCITFPFSAAPRILGLTSNSSSRRFQYTFPNPSGLRYIPCNMKSKPSSCVTTP
jgi:hypothetical protein